MGRKPTPPPPEIRRRATQSIYENDLLSPPVPMTYSLLSIQFEKLRIENDYLREQIDTLKVQLIKSELDALGQQTKARLIEEKIQNVKNALLSEICEQPISYFGEHDTMLVTYSRWRSNQALQLRIRTLYNVIGFSVALSAVLVLHLVYCALTGGL